MLSKLIDSRARGHAADSDCRREIQQSNSYDRLAPPGQFNKQIIDLVDQMILRLRQYANDFNLAVGWNLHVTATPPSYVSESESLTTYRARLATRLWSLILRAERNRIDFFLIPTHSVLGPARPDGEYPPVSSVSFDGERFWQDGRPVHIEDGGEKLCQFVFRMLVSKCIQNVAVKTEDPFASIDEEALANAMPPAGKDTGSARTRNLSLKAERNANTRNGFSNEMEPAIMTRYDVYNDVLLCFTFLAQRINGAISDVSDHGAQAFRRRDLNGVKRCCLALVAIQTNEARVTELRREWIAMNGMSVLLAECTEYGAGSVKHDPASSKISDDVPSALKCLIKSIDHVSNTLIECGAKAFSNRDFERVDQFRTLAMQSDQFKVRAEILHDEWCMQVPEVHSPFGENTDWKPMAPLKAITVSAS